MNASTIDPLTLPSLPLTERSQLPKCSAIYFVLNGERVLYIGQTVNLAQRWIAHHKWGQLLKLNSNAKIAWLECSDTNLLAKIETALIRQFQPELNIRECLRPNPFERTEKVTFTCTPEMKEYLADWASNDRRSISNLVEGLIAEVIAERKLEMQNESLSPKKRKGAA